MLRMNEYYRISHFLKDSSLDRIYPCEDYFLDEEGNPVIYDGDSFIFDTNRQTFTGIDYVEVLLETSESYSTSGLEFCISEYMNAYSPEMVLSADNEVVLEANVPTKVVFPIRKTMTMSEASRDLTGVRSVELKTPNNASTKIHEFSFRSYNPKYTLEEIDSFHENGVYYVTSRLHMTEIPDELQDHVYTATAGYAWMSVWEFDARIMNDDQKNAMSYGKWLFAIVDNGIEDYKISHDISDDDELFIEEKLVHSLPLRW